jgi:ankyrin repeat protein
MDAAEAGNVRVVKVLLAAGARTQARHHNGSTAMDFARAGNHHEVIRMLSGQAGSQPSRSPGSNAVTIGTPAPTVRQTLPAQKGERQ